LSGELVKVSQKPDVNFFGVEDGTGRINVVAFNKMGKIKKGESVQVEGRVELYEGDLEIIADKITII